jgi:glycosyltransferase involved in cell wall biosynthesis
MTVFVLRHYLLAHDVYEVVALNIGERRNEGNDEALSTKGRLDYLWKVIRFALHGYIIHLETNGHNFKSWLSALVCSVAGLLNRRKTVIAFGSGSLPEYLQQVSGMARLVVRIVLNRAGIVICRNHGMLEALRAFGGQRLRIELVPGFMGLSGREFGPLPNRVDEFCNTHEPVLGATVNLSPEYGIPLALQAVEHMQKRYPKLGMIFIGIGPEAEKDLPELSLVRDHVLLAGQLAPDITLSVMRRLSVFVRPTYFEGDSLSVREALVLGIPVVASDTGSRPDGVLLFKVGDCTDLCRQLSRVLEKESLATRPDASPKPEEGSARKMLELYREL